jgi:hypothetical protein
VNRLPHDKKTALKHNDNPIKKHAIFMIFRRRLTTLATKITTSLHFIAANNPLSRATAAGVNPPDKTAPAQQFSLQL